MECLRRPWHHLQLSDKDWKEITKQVKGAVLLLTPFTRFYNLMVRVTPFWLGASPSAFLVVHSPLLVLLLLGRQVREDCMERVHYALLPLVLSVLPHCAPFALPLSLCVILARENSLSVACFLFTQHSACCWTCVSSCSQSSPHIISLMFHVLGLREERECWTLWYWIWDWSENN